MAEQTDSNPKTEREKYVEKLQAKLEKAGKARRFLDSEDGSLITEFLTEQINGIIKNIGGVKYINDLSQTNYERGQLAMAQKILTMITAEASTDTQAISESLTAARNDG